MADSIFVDYARPVQGFGRKSGEQVTFTRVGALPEPVDATLLERDLMPEDTFTLSTGSIYVKEIGRAVPYTSLSDDLSVLVWRTRFRNVLRDQMHLVLDTHAATAFKGTPIKYTPTGTTATPTSTISTTGRRGRGDAEFPGVRRRGDSRLPLRHAPRAGVTNDEYIGIFRSLALRGIKNDPNWEVWHQYADPDAKYNSEVGKYEGIRFIETNHTRALGKVGPAACSAKASCSARSRSAWRR